MQSEPQTPIWRLLARTEQWSQPAGGLRSPSASINAILTRHYSVASRRLTVRAINMGKLSTTVSSARVVRECDCSVFEVLGASVEFLFGPQQGDEAPCILKGTIPTGVLIPMHSHDVIERCSGSKRVWETSSKSPATQGMHSGTGRKTRCSTYFSRPPSTDVTFRKSADD